MITSKLTAQSQISVPAEVRRKLGVGPGAVLAWETRGDEVTVRRVGKFSSQDVHEALFASKTPKRASLTQMKAAIRERMRRKHARD
jgi:AbrB family looped-hinge helix DNA binding protein